jgi:hypothetical protein
MSQFFRSREFLLGLIILIQFFIYVPYFFDVPSQVKSVESGLLTMGVVIATFALLVGLYTINRREALKISRRTKGWILSVWLLVVLWLMIITGLVLGQTSVFYTFFTTGIVVPGDATIYAILVFYMISAGARAFKMRDLQSSLLIITTVLVLLQQAPVTAYLWPGFVTIGSWLVNNLGMPITRTFTIISAIGGIVLAVRLITGKEMGITGLLKGKKKEEGNK